MNRPYTKGTLAMARRGRNENGSQFFIVLGERVGFPPNFTIFGKLIRGADHLKDLGDVAVDEDLRGEKSRPTYPPGNQGHRDQNGLRGKAMELMEIINRHRRASEAHANPICPIYRLLLLVVQKHSPKEHIIYIETEFGEPTGPRYMRPQLTENPTLADSEGGKQNCTRPGGAYLFWPALSMIESRSASAVSPPSVI